MIEYLSKCKNIQRLSQTFHFRNYDLMSHQYMVGMLFKHFAELEDIQFTINEWDIVLKHDIVEVETMDLSHVVKNFSEKTKKSWEIIESEITKSHIELEKYSDENIKKSLNKVQFDLFKACDILDLLMFVVEEISLGNRTKSIKQVEKNCLSLIGKNDTQFISINNFISENIYGK